jgi:pantothenate kinase
MHPTKEMPTMTDTDPSLPDICAAIQAAPIKGRRRVVALAGPPASGKSTFANQIADHLTAQGNSAQAVPMDGFHLDNSELDLRGLRSRKGAPETFDIAGLTDLIGRLGTEDKVPFPTFDRSHDRAAPDGGVLSHGVETVIVEGNYLLFDDKGWRDLYDLWDFRIFLTFCARVSLTDGWPMTIRRFRPKPALMATIWPTHATLLHTACLVILKLLSLIRSPKRFLESLVTALRLRKDLTCEPF